MSEVYSYHTFVLPFIWNVRGISRKLIEEFPKCFDQNPKWIRTDLEEEHKINTNSDLMTDDDAYALYKEYQYFNPAARRAIYGFGSGIVKNYCFDPSMVRNKGKYVIEKGDVKYTLFINGIRLKIYNTGVALFILECENPKGGEYAAQNNIDAVKNINDYGRRIALPFIPHKKGGYYSICADRLTLDLGNGIRFVSDNIEFAKSIECSDDIYNKISLTHMCDFIKKLLEFGSDYKFTTNPKRANPKENVFYIYPALDDRMFVLCVVYSNDDAAKYSAVKGDKYAYEVDESVSKDLYELIFVDPANECTCQDKRSREQLLEEHVYRRWLPWGTVYGIANQSLICVTNHSYTVESVLTQYAQMAYLGLVQRASIINFQREVTTLSQSIEKQGRSMKTATITRVLDLQERFVAFQNQLSFTEVSPQEQAIDVYNRLIASFYIEKERETLGAQLECLYSAANTTLDFSLNKGGSIIAVVAIILAAVSFLADLGALIAYYIGKNPEDLPFDIYFTVLGVTIAFTVIISLCFMYFYRRKR